MTTVFYPEKRGPVNESLCMFSWMLKLWVSSQTQRGFHHPMDEHHKCNWRGVDQDSEMRLKTIMGTRSTEIELITEERAHKALRLDVLITYKCTIYA